MFMAVNLLSLSAALFACTVVDVTSIKLQPAPLDCSAVRCLNPVCEEDETSRVLPGQCCPTCQPNDSILNCSGAICPQLRCAPDHVLKFPEGECCAKCEPIDRCFGIPCALPLCAGNSRPVVPEGECCPICLPDCSFVLCFRPECKPGETLVTPEGECCPKCQLDCSAVLCFKPVCKPGQILVTPEGECCPKCQLDCTLVDCALPVCTTGERVEVPEGQCCPVCVPDPSCAAVSCIVPVCPAGQVAKVPEGECCPKCQLDCTLVDCALPVCTTGERVEVPEGQCCPVCVPDPTCAAVSCIVPVCPAGQVAKVPEGECCAVCVCEIDGQTFSQCASACPRTCEVHDIFCRAQCRPGCQCPPNQVIDSMNKRCVPLEECPEPCPVRGQIRSECAGCDTTCAQFINQELVFCPAVCRVGGCTCPPGQVIDTLSNECFTPDECPNACETKECQPGSRCKVFEPTGEAFCNPSCDIDNGGCPSNQSCSLQVVQCVRAPCPPVVQCTDICTLPAEVGLCDGVFPRFFHNATSKQCERFIYGGCGGNENNFETLNDCETKCEDICSLPAETGPCRAYIPRYFHNSTSKQCERFIYGGCRGNKNNFETLSDCESKCEDACASKECRPGSSCEIFEPTGEAFCAPSCDIDNGGCPSNQSCSLQVVQCVRAPCPPVVQCTDICTLPADPGPCEALITRFFHNARSKQCERFIYGGCDGNENNFKTLEACESQCEVSSPCDTMSCPDGFRCEVFNNEEGFCQPDCSLNNGGCAPDETCRLENVVCVRAPCPPHRVCEPSCPPTCSKEFCLANPRKPCSDPGPREIPGCRGRCQFSYCRACYVGDDPVFPPPGNCPLCNLADYTSNTRCYRRWARCIKRAHRRRFGRPDFTSDEEFRCYRPPCPLRG